MTNVESSLQKTTFGKKPGLTSFDIKIIAIIAMFIDHAGAILLMPRVTIGDALTTEETIIKYLYYLVRGIGRLAFPLFIFLLVQGFIYTGNRAKYAIRLFLFALISEVPFDRGFRNSFWDPTYQNVFFTLLLGFLFMWFTDFIYRVSIKPILGYVAQIAGSIAMGSYLGIFILNMLNAYEYNVSAPASISVAIALSSVFILALSLHINRYKSFNDLSCFCCCLIVLAVCMFAADYLHTDYSGPGVLAIAAAYCFRKDKKRAMCMTCAALVVASVFEAVALINVPIINRYNGEKGKSMKYFFYVFYPAHIILLTLISYILS